MARRFFAAGVAIVLLASAIGAPFAPMAEAQSLRPKARPSPAPILATAPPTSIAEKPATKVSDADREDYEGTNSDILSEVTEDGRVVPSSDAGLPFDPDANEANAVPSLRPQPRNDAIIPAEALEPASNASRPARDPSKGEVTNLPLPRYVTLKTGEGNARRGPGLTHRIDWVFTRAGMPLKLTAEYGHWRRIEDADGLGGWVHYALLSGTRAALVTTERTKFYSRPDSSASVLFEAEHGVVGKLVECDLDWCRVSIEGNRGWAPISALWGVDPGEILE